MTTTTTSDLPVLELDRAGWRSWLAENHSSSRGCWLVVDRRKGPDASKLAYLDAVEEALCFGWIDSTLRPAGDLTIQRFTPRRKDSNWTELNIVRCERLERLGLMTDAGRAAIPDRTFSIDDDVMAAIRSDPEASANFDLLPQLYVRIRVANIQCKRGPLCSTTGSIVFSRTPAGDWSAGHGMTAEGCPDRRCTIRTV